MSILALAAATPSPVLAQSPAGGGASAPLALRASCDATGPKPVMRVQLTNTSGKATSVILGFDAAAGKTHVVNSIQVIAIRPATGAEEAYAYLNPKFALATGPAWTVSLAAGATHDLELPLWDFISTSNFNSLDAGVVGGTRLVFEARPSSAKSSSVWTGRIQTTLDACRVG